MIILILVKYETDTRKEVRMNKIDLLNDADSTIPRVISRNLTSADLDFTYGEYAGDRRIHRSEQEKSKNRYIAEESNRDLGM